ncbi:putative coiled-coil protein SlyX [Aureimonas jatrophae]|uniref:Uncharacterized protein n=1 Tax=Aureimonas jatrophae TaxID=1166073 RepID=A0A1H0HB61_9HYPH|nr:putative coiled-coil protein SlyX [Aureimonas jatrophae]SDO16294.1 hypothetical protein SAMN05192530_1044 [Aureimonas jatrophae]
MGTTNARIDQSLSNISAHLTEIHQALGGLSASVAVLTQRFDSRRRSVGPEHSITRQKDNLVNGAIGYSYKSI